jgi:hypothetical protein
LANAITASSSSGSCVISDVATAIGSTIRSGSLCNSASEIGRERRTRRRRSDRRQRLPNGHRRREVLDTAALPLCGSGRRNRGVGGAAGRGRSVLESNRAGSVFTSWFSGPRRVVGA